MRSPVHTFDSSSLVHSSHRPHPAVSMNTSGALVSLVLSTPGMSLVEMIEFCIYIVWDLQSDLSRKLYGKNRERECEVTCTTARVYPGFLRGNHFFMWNVAHVLADIHCTCQKQHVHVHLHIYMYMHISWLSILRTANEAWYWLHELNVLTLIMSHCYLGVESLRLRDCPLWLSEAWSLLKFQLLTTWLRMLWL